MKVILNISPNKTIPSRVLSKQPSTQGQPLFKGENTEIKSKAKPAQDSVEISTKAAPKKCEGGNCK